MNLLEAIASDLHRPEEHLRLPAELIRQGYDPTYLARVRPDELNQLDAATLTRLRRALRFHDDLEASKQRMIEEAKADGWWSDAMDRAIAAAQSNAEVHVLTRNVRGRRSARNIAAANPKAEKVAMAILMYSGEPPQDFKAWVLEQAGDVEPGEVETGDLKRGEVETAHAEKTSIESDTSQESVIANGVSQSDTNASPLDSAEQSQSTVENKQHKSADKLISEVKAYLQALMLEDAALVSKVFNFIRDRAIVKSSPVDDSKAGSADNKAAAENSTGAPNKKSRRRKKTGGKSEKAEPSKTTDEASEFPTVLSELASEDSGSVASTEASTDSTSVAFPAANAESDSQAAPAADHDASSTQEQQQQSSDETQPDPEQSPLASSAEGQTTSEPSSKPVASDETATVDPTAESGAEVPIENFSDKKSVKKTRAVSAKDLSPRQRRRRWLKIQLEPYRRLKREIGRLSSYQIVMLGRGNRSQILKVQLDYDRRAVARMARESLSLRDHPLANFLSETVDEAVAGLLAARIESEVFADAEEAAQHQLIRFAVDHLQNLLMQRPLRGHRIMMIDAIGQKTAAVVIVDPEGRIDQVAELNCISTRPDAVNQNVQLLGELTHTYQVSVIALSTGPARRYLLPSIREFMSQCDPAQVRWTYVDRDGADAYCQTRLALSELPTLSRRHRAAAWLAWRMQDPLVQLLKIDPTRLRLAVFQAELPEEMVAQSLREAVASAVAKRGIDFWNASKEGIACVPGLDDKSAVKVCDIRDKQQPETREILAALLKDQLEERHLRQAIGFLRLFGSSQTLDGTLIHPDDYRLAERLIESTKQAPPPAAPAGWHKPVARPETASDVALVEPSDESASDDVVGTAVESLPPREPVTHEAPATFGIEKAATVEPSEIQASETSESNTGATDASEETNTTDETSEAASKVESSGDTADAQVSVEPVAVPPEPKVVQTIGGHPLAVVRPSFDEPDNSKTSNSADSALTAVETTAAEKPAAETPAADTEAATSAETKAAPVDVEKLARSWQVGREKLKFVAAALAHPFDDPAEQSIPIPLMARVPKIEELKPGMTLWSIVSGITEFGVFADLGPDCSGLIHVSRLSATPVEDPHQVVNVGDLVQVWVLNVDLEKRRISLTALPPNVEQELRDQQRDQQRDQGQPYRGGRDNSRNNADRPSRQSSSSNDRPRGQNRGGGSGERSSSPSQGQARGGSDRGRQGAGGGRGGDSRGRGGDSRGLGGDSKGRGRSRQGSFGAATVVDLPGKDTPAIARKGNSSSNEAPQGKEPLRSFSDLLASFQTKQDDAKKPPTPQE